MFERRMGFFHSWILLDCSPIGQLHLSKQENQKDNEMYLSGSVVEHVTNSGGIPSIHLKDRLLFLEAKAAVVRMSSLLRGLHDARSTKHNEKANLLRAFALSLVAFRFHSSNFT